MAEERATASLLTVTLAFLGGAILGAGAGLLLAPWSGSETRAEVERSAKRAKKDALEKAREIEAGLEARLERGKQFVSEKKSVVSAAIEAGRQALTKESA